MRVGILAVGRLKAGAERELTDRYVARFAKLGPSLGFEFGGIREIAESRAATADLRRADEGERLLQRLGDNVALVVLDERGTGLNSQEFAGKVSAWRDAGRGGLLLVVGGPDGHDETVRRRADLLLAMGAQTWPHQLMRAMVAEQLYRTATILGGHPYHRS